MASPFTIFRKHQKILIAVLGLMAMIAFVFLPIILKRMDSGPRRANSPVVTTDKFGDLSEQQVEILLWQRQKAIRFLQLAITKTLGQPVNYQAVERIFGPTAEESVVRSWLLRQYAHEMGMRVSDAIVNQFIQRITQQQLSAEELAAITKETGITEPRLFEALRNELTALYFERIFFGGMNDLEATTPAQRWDYFKRLKRKATTQMVAVPVERFVSEISDPDEKVLKEFFEKYKTDYSDPRSPEPGFHEPRRLKIEYLVAKYDTFNDPKAVTDKEIEEYYEANKDPFYIDPGFIDREETPEGSPAAETPEGGTPKEEPATPESPAEEKPADAPKDGDKTETPAEKPAEATAEPAPEKPAETKPAEPVKEPEKPAETKPEEAKPEETPSEKPEETKPAEPVKEPEKPAEAKPEETKPEETPKPDENSDAGRPSPFRLVSETRAAEPAAEGAVPTADETEKGDGNTAAEVAATAPAGESEKKVRFYPLKDIKEEVRQTVAREQASERIEKAFTPIRDQMRKYRDEWIRAAALLASDDDSGEETIEVKDLPRPDLAAMAKKANLEFKTTGWIDQNAAAELPIAQSAIDMMTPVIQKLFDGQYPEFLPGVSQDNEGNAYLFWVTAEKAERVPEFEDKGVREEVLAAWKMIEARKLAKKEAESLIEQAKKAGKTLKEEFGGKPGIEVIEPDPFTWLTRGPAPSMSRQPARISPVEGVDIPGRDFMKAVFALSKGEFGVAMNNPEKIAYAVEMISLSPSDNLLWELYRMDDFAKYMDAGAGDRYEQLNAIQKELDEEAGLKWERKPAPYRPVR